MVSYAKYSPVPTEEPKRSSEANSAFDYSSAFNYKSAFNYHSNNTGHYESAFDYGYNSQAMNSDSSGRRDSKRRKQGFTILDFLSKIITLISYLIIGITFPITLWFCLKKLEQWERLIVFRIGRLRGVMGPGMVFIIPWIDRFNRVDMRTKAFSVPPQQVITVDNGIIEMGCEVKYRVSDVQQMTTSITTPEHGLRSFGKTVMLNVLTKHTVREMERDRLLIASQILKELNARVCSWGLEIGQVELSTVNILKEPEAKNPLKPLLGALGGGGSSTDMPSPFSALSSLGAMSPQETTVPTDKGSSALHEFTNLAKLSGLSGFQGFSASGFEKGHLKDELMRHGGGDGTLKTNLGCFLRGLVESPSSAELGQGIYRLQVEGADGAVYTLFVNEGRRHLVEGDSPSVTPDVSIVVSKDDLMSILEGSLPPLQAYLSGRLSVTGDIQLLMGLDVLRQASAAPTETDTVFGA